MKKFLAILLSLAMMVSVMPAAFAADTAEVTANVDYYSNVIAVEYTNPASYSCYVNVYMANENDVNGDVFTNFEKAVRMDMAKVAGNSKATFEFTLGADIDDGNYYFFAAPSGAQSTANYAKSAIVPIISLGTASSEVLPYINSGDDTNTAKRAYEKLAEVFAFAESSSPAWKDEYLYDIKVDDFGGAFTNIAQIEDAWNTADLIYGAKTAEDTLSEKMTAMIEGLGLDAQNEDYVNYKSTFEMTLQRNLNVNGAYSKADAVEQFGKTAAVIAVNNRDTDGIAKAVETYQKELGISDALLTEMKSKTIVAVVRNMGDFTVNSGSEFVSKVEAVLPTIGAPQNYKPQGGGSAGGGGGGGISIDPSLEQQLNPNVSLYTFTDVGSTHWALKPVEYLADKGVLSGNGDGTFAPDKTVTREEFVKMIIAAFGFESSGSGISFTDVGSNHWAYKYIEAAVENSIVKGISDTKFGIGSYITRQDMAVIANRIIGLKGISIQAGTASFTDDAKIDDYAKDAVNVLAGAGIINGYTDGSFKPQGSLTRAEAAKVIYELVNR